MALAVTRKPAYVLLKSSGGEGGWLQDGQRNHWREAGLAVEAGDEGAVGAGGGDVKLVRASPSTLTADISSLSNYVSDVRVV